MSANLQDSSYIATHTIVRPLRVFWIDTWQVSDILGITHDSVQKVLTESNDYQQVRRKLRGKAGKLSARGQGHLFYREDILRIAQIRQGARCGVMTAARFFAAERLGKI